MEDSIQSSMSKALCSEDGAASGEESGWTVYLEDFMATEQRGQASGCSSVLPCGSSIVSDAASCAAWSSSGPIEASESCKKLSFNRRKARRCLDDDSLDDTASSPHNSPKVSDLNQMGMNPRKEEDNTDSAQVTKVLQQKDVGCENCEERRRAETDELGIIEGTIECTELKKRGLCLVPLSMLVDYIG